MGASVILVEHRKMGGDCLNNGCVPSKALLAAAKIGHQIEESAKFGWLPNKAKVDFKKVHKHVQGVIKAIAPHDSVERFESLGVKVILEEGHFRDDKTLETTSYTIQAKRFIIATGSSPFIPPIEGLSSIAYYTNETIFDLRELPKHFVVIGGGPIGIEIAQAFHRLGSQVTVLEAFTALPKDDPEITCKLKEILIREGIELQEGIKILSLKQKKPETIECYYSDSQNQTNRILASHVFVATGRMPNIHSLNLAVAKIKSSSKGIEVDAKLRTSNARVYAIGDCTGGYQFTHVAGYHAGIAIRNTIFKMGARIQTNAIPWVTYTDPELAHVGFTELQLQQQKIPHKVLRLSFQENDRAQTEMKTEGCIKALVSSKGNILGVTILGMNAGELIYPWVMAIQNKLKISAIANTIAPYPTLSDINKQIGGAYYKDRIFSLPMKKFVKFMLGITR